MFHEEHLHIAIKHEIHLHNYSLDMTFLSFQFCFFGSVRMEDIQMYQVNQTEYLIQKLE